MYLCGFHISYASSASFYTIINVTPLVGHRKQTKKILRATNIKYSLPFCKSQVQKCASST